MITIKKISILLFLFISVLWGCTNEAMMNTTTSATKLPPLPRDYIAWKIKKPHDTFSNRAAAVDISGGLYNNSTTAIK
jgi:hypothetical protein